MDKLQVGVLMSNEAIRHDLHGTLAGKDHREDDLNFFLEYLSHYNSIIDHPYHMTTYQELVDSSGVFIWSRLKDCEAEASAADGCQDECLVVKIEMKIKAARERQMLF